MKPYYQDTSVTIYHGDCRELLPKLSADLVVTDPPYGVAFKYGQHDDGNMVGYCALIGDVLNQLQGFPIFITCGKRNLWSYPPAKDVFCWQKPGSTRRNNLGGFNEWELVLVYGSPPKKPVTDWIRLPDVANHDAGNEHPCPKPLRLFTWLVEQGTEREHSILDPFMGSGTTLRAAKDLGRKAIGIEIEEKYCEIAARRMEQEVLTFEPACPQRVEASTESLFQISP